MSGPWVETRSEVPGVYFEGSREHRFGKGSALCCTYPSLFTETLNLVCHRVLLVYGGKTGALDVLRQRKDKSVLRHGRVTNKRKDREIDRDTY